MTYYSVYLEENEHTETEHFFAKKFPKHADELAILKVVIKEMSRKGAKKRYFKFEEAADALPMVSTSLMDENKEDFGIRLYCIRLNEEIVILLNGGIKTSRKVEDCKNCKTHFTNANRISKALDKCINNREIKLDEKDCLIEFELHL